MGGPDPVLWTLHVMAAVAVTLMIAFLARRAARSIGQPPVIGEITAGLLIGPAVVLLGGRAALDAVVPADVLGVLRTLGQAGLVLFLVGVAHELRGGLSGARNPRLGWLLLGSLLPGLLAGGVLAGWVLGFGSADLRGTAPTPALVLLLAVALSVTAVPVLARILVDRGMIASVVGRLALGVAVVIDVVAWLGLTVAVGLASGGMDGLLRTVAVLVGGLAATLAVRRFLASHPAPRASRLTGAVLGALALGVAVLVEQWGMTAIVGAFLVGLAVPGQGWGEAVRLVGRIGALFTPVFFVATGVTLLAGTLAASPWELIALATVLAVVAKILGGYLGARLAGHTRWTGLRFGVLMNTRGLTEIVLLQAGYRAGILTGPLFVALLVMALVTTGLTGPLLTLIDRRAARHEAVPLPSGVPQGGAR